MSNHTDRPLQPAGYCPQASAEQLLAKAQMATDHAERELRNDTWLVSPASMAERAIGGAAGFLNVAEDVAARSDDAEWRARWNEHVAEARAKIADFRNRLSAVSQTDVRDRRAQHEPPARETGPELEL